MWSPNSAYTEGRRIGREFPTTWVSDEELMAAVREEIGPRIKLRESTLGPGGDGYVFYGSLIAVLSALSLACIVIQMFFADALWVPPVVLAAPLLILIGLSASSGLLAVLLFVLASRTAADRRRRWRAQHMNLIAAAYKGASESLQRRRAKTGVPVAPAAGATHSTAGRPGAHPNGVTPRQAEQIAAQWMRFLGARDSQVTQYGSDGGIDVASAKYVAQVKHFSKTIGVVPVRELAGVVRADGRRGLFFATNSFSSGAVDFADRTGLALFRLYPERGEITAVNQRAAAFLRHGL